MNTNTEDINPDVTQNFVKHIEDTSGGSYNVEVRFGDEVISLEVDPNVFPPQSDYSISSKSLSSLIEDMQGKTIAEIGVGTGIESIIALKRGARSVEGGDINVDAVRCAEKNIESNGFSCKAEIFYSDLFENFPPNKRYDLIIANLPIVNYNPNDGVEGTIDIAKQKIFGALYDKDFELHKRLFEQAKGRLTDDGEIIFTHANLQSQNTSTPDYDFEQLEKLIEEYGYIINKVRENEDMGYKWRSYSIKLVQ